MLIREIDELQPVDIGVAVPTRNVPVRELASFNMPTWARNVTASSVAACQKSGAGVQEIERWLQQHVDPDLAAHVCEFAGNASCNVTSSPTEDRNRYLDLRLKYDSVQRLDGTTRVGIRVVVAEDAGKAINTPLSFDVVLSAVNVNGKLIVSDCIGKHRTPELAGRCIDELSLSWAHSSVIAAAVNTTAHWAWQKCTPREAASAPQARALLGGGGDFTSALQSAILAALPSSVPWSLEFADGESPNPPIKGPWGLSFTMTYVLCGHLMFAQPVVWARKAPQATRP